MIHFQDGGVYPRQNYGTIEIDWKSETEGGPVVNVFIRDAFTGRVKLQETASRLSHVGMWENCGRCVTHICTRASQNLFMMRAKLCGVYARALVRVCVRLYS